MQHADDVLVAGDTLYVRGGSYTTTQYFASTVSGTSGHPIVIMASPGERPVFTGLLNGGNGRFSITNSYYDIIGIVSIDGHSSQTGCRIVVLSGATHVNFKNCLFEGYRASKLEQTCGFYENVRIDGGSSYITMDACTVQYQGEGCVYGNNTQQDGFMVHMEGNVDHIVLKNGAYRFGSHDEIRMASAGSSLPKYVIIRNNLIDQGGTDVWADGFGGGYGIGVDRRIAGDSSLQYIVIEGNRFRGGGSVYRQKCPMYFEGGCGFSIRKNLIWNSVNKAMYFSSYYANSYLKHNFVYNNTVAWSGDMALYCFVAAGHDPNVYWNNNLFANNLFYDAREHRDPDWPNNGYLLCVNTSGASPNWWSDANTWGANHFKNNLWREINIGGDTTLYQAGGGVDHGWKGRDYPQKRWPQAFTGNLFWEPDGVTPINPRFDQYGFAGVTLLSTSPCIDAGIDMNPIDTVVNRLLTTADSTWARSNGVGTLVWKGAAPDIGAFEFNSGNPAPPVSPAIHRLGPPLR